MKWALTLLLVYVVLGVYLEWRKARRWEREMRKRNRNRNQ